MTTPEPSTLEPYDNADLDAFERRVRDAGSNACWPLLADELRMLIAQARAARPSPTCGTCQHWGQLKPGPMLCQLAHSPCYAHATEETFGCMLHQPVAPSGGPRERTWRPVLRRLRDEVVQLSGDPENCDDCGDKAEAGNDEPCALHQSAELYHAIVAADELLGPCVCGHTVGEHYDEDTTRCKLCDCHGFRLPPLPAPLSDPKET